MRQRAFTLIELLITTAIIAILAGGTLALLLLPLREAGRAGAIQGQGQGLATLSVSLVQEIHGAFRIEELENGYRLDLGTESISYRVDGTILRRQVGEGVAVALVEHVEHFYIATADTDRMTTVSIRVAQDTAAGPVVFDQTYRVARHPLAEAAP